MWCCACVDINVILCMWYCVCDIVHVLMCIWWCDIVHVIVHMNVSLMCIWCCACDIVHVDVNVILCIWMCCWCACVDVLCCCKRSVTHWAARDPHTEISHYIWCGSIKPNDLLLWWVTVNPSHSSVSRAHDPSAPMTLTVYLCVCVCLWRRPTSSSSQPNTTYK